MSAAVQLDQKALRALAQMPARERIRLAPSDEHELPWSDSAWRALLAKHPGIALAQAWLPRGCRRVA